MQVSLSWAIVGRGRRQQQHGGASAVGRRTVDLVAVVEVAVVEPPVLVADGVSVCQNASIKHIEWNQTKRNENQNGEIIALQPEFLSLRA